MKTVYTFTAVLLSIAMLFLPLISTIEPSVASTGAELPNEEALSSNSTKPQEEEKTIRVYLTEEKRVETIKIEDYIFGVVAAEMPALYEEEALKAQAVAAYTYMLYKYENKTNSEYDITDSFKTDQAFITREKAREKWGEDAAKHEEKINKAVKATLYQKLTYNGKTILAAYHAISFGKTEDAKEIWGEGYPYLCSTESNGDKLSPNYMTKVDLTTEELKSKLSSLATFSGDAKDYFGTTIKSEAGTVKTILLCGKEVGGSDIRAALELRSSNFTVSFKDDVFTFTVLGYGHSLGLSQYGAHYMAMQGKNYKEILLHYYKDCVLE